MTLTLTPNVLRILADIVAILQSAHIRVRAGIWDTVIAFDAFVTYAVVKYAQKNNAESKGLLRIAIKAELNCTTASQRDEDVERFVAQHTWRKAINHKWTAGPYQERDINIRKAAAANMSLEWSTKSYPPNSVVAMISDSTAT